MEADNDYQDKAVAGGLDRFLATLQKEANAHPAIKTLMEIGLLSVGYAELSASQRKRWANEAKRFLGSEPQPKRATVRSSSTPSARITNSISPDAPVLQLRSVTRPNAAKLERIDVRTVRDLVYLFPNRHLDYSKRRTVSELSMGEEQTIVATIWEVNETRLGRGGRLRATEAVVGDDTGNIRVIWFGQPWLAQALRRAITAASQTTGSAKVVLSGKVTVFNGRPQMESPEWEALDDPETADLIHTGRHVPLYPSPDGIPARTMRRMVREALSAITVNGALQIDDPLPDTLRRELGLLVLPLAIAQSHYPDTEARKEEARRRLAFDEFLILQLALRSTRDTPDKPPGIKLHPYPGIVEAFIASLPFTLTGGQQGAIEDAMAEVSIAKRPMNRLLQGDVGSGKTVVGLAMMLAAVAEGYQGALMAPTEVLAEQHFFNVRRLLAGVEHPIANSDWFSFHLDGRTQPITIALLTGSTRAAPRREIQRMVGDGVLDILVGTHALIQHDVDLPNLALAIIDEQHRFGVLQRAALRSKGADPHVLLMSATPIPRTLELTLYGELDISTMPELPTGRKEILTRIVAPSRSQGAEQFLVDQVSQGHQCFVVCPLIDESEAVLARAATAEFERLSSTSLAEIRVGLLHGRMSLADKQEVMDRFRVGELDVLVATPVIEVGIDVPNATVMMIQGADRFGLAQLHQLRGRVGRGPHQSYCFLLSDTLSEDAQKRLDVLVNTNDGFEIAEADLRFRGSGDLFGTRQSGYPSLRMASYEIDRDLLEKARDQASSLLDVDPQLETLPALRDAVSRYANSVTDEA